MKRSLECGDGTLDFAGDFFQDIGILRQVENVVLADREELALARLGKRDQEDAPARHHRNDDLHRRVNALHHLEELLLALVEFPHQSVPPALPPGVSSFSTSALITSAPPISMVPTRCQRMVPCWSMM